LGYLGKLDEILPDLFRADDQFRIQRSLATPERRIGYALQFCRGIDRGMRQRDRRGQPPPDRGDNAEGYDEKRQRRAKGNWLCPPGGTSIMVKRSAQSGRNAGHSVDLHQRPNAKVTCALITNLSRPQQVK
jgi:hypothetical protein